MIIKKMRTRLPEKYKIASGACVADGVIFDIDISSKKVTEIRRIKI